MIFKFIKSMKGDEERPMGGGVNGFGVAKGNTRSHPPPKKILFYTYFSKT